MTTPEQLERVTQDYRERFWAKVDKSGECWLWTGAQVTGGYGAFTIHYKRNRAHRVSWVLANGDIPEGLIVCHKCDVRLCVRPDHLFIGTYKDNGQDMAQKGRSNIGEKNPLSKLSEQHVEEIVRMYRQGVKPRAIADLFNISPGYVSQIARGLRWKHVPVARTKAQSFALHPYMGYALSVRGWEKAANVPKGRFNHYVRSHGWTIEKCVKDLGIRMAIRSLQSKETQDQ